MAIELTPDIDTDQLMREWNEHLQKNRYKPCMLLSVDDKGAVHITSINEFTKDHIIDVCERLIEIYKQK